VVGDERVEKRLVVVLQIAHEGVFAEGRRLVVEGLLAAFALILEGADVGRQQAVKGKGGALFFGECGAFIEPRMKQKVVA
jgi:hypothetical protein